MQIVTEPSRNCVGSTTIAYRGTGIRSVCVSRVGMVDLIVFFLGLLLMMWLLSMILMQDLGWRSSLRWRQLNCRCEPWLGMCWVR